MSRLPICINLFLTNRVNRNYRRNLSKYLDKDITSKAIRQRFIDYFINDHSHTFVRSSPVIPYCDPTVAFVNAGMNQFKGIFLGTQMPQYPKVANSQKCIRVGGKHNDLSVVGLDGYHHTFFEMLGNWSFGEYFKKDACRLAWELLTRKYKINKGILYVTYFGGDNLLGLQPDLECRDIWRTIGIPEERILPFGVKDNFWEMGPTGPCGPCTEIHVDLFGTINRAKFVNKGLPDLTELWNIVFIEYNRNADGTIDALPQKHIDTGMGFERLTALLQGKISNYDTDIFTNLFTGIQKISKSVPSYGGKFGERDWNSLDTNYRILADHARMIVVCLGDGVIPEQNQKLRRIMRKVFEITETTFKKEKGLLKELSNYVVENLGTFYPELERNIKQIHQIIDYEEEVYRSLRANSAIEWEKLVQEQPELTSLDVIEMPGLVAAYKEIRTLSKNTISPALGFKLYDTYGLDEDTIIKMSQTLNLLFDTEAFRKELEKAKTRSREQTVLNSNEIYNQLVNSNVKLTDNSYKYRYKKQQGGYIFDKLQVRLVKTINNNSVATSIKPGIDCSVILDKSNLYTESGGQCSDKGYIKFDDGLFQIENTQNLNGYILHKGTLKSDNQKSIEINATGNLEIDKEFRLNNMRNHTATHLLNSVLKQIKGATCQKSSKVTSDYLNFDVGIFGDKLTTAELQQIEDTINKIIKKGVNVNTSKINSQTLLNMNNVVLVPGEIYPDTGIRLIEIVGPDDFQSREPCCGTHVLNTADIEDFCIIGFRSLGRSTTSLHAVTGGRAHLARKNGSELLESIVALQKSVNDNIDKPEILDMAVTNLKKNLKYDVDSSAILPVIVKQRCSEMLNGINKQIKDISKGTLKEFIEVEMENVIKMAHNKSKNNKKYIVHYLACSTMLDSVPLHKATKLCRDIPVLVISYSDNIVKARCCVPENMKSKCFDAEKWLRSCVSTVFNSRIIIPKGQDSTLVCTMKSKKINIKDWDTLLKQSMENAKIYADEYLK